MAAAALEFAGRLVGARPSGSKYALFELPDPAKVVTLGVERVTACYTSHERQHDVKPFHCDLAASFGKLKDGGYIKELDEHLKVTVGPTTKAMSKLVQEAKSHNRSIGWSEVVATMAQNPWLEPFGDRIERADRYLKQGTNVFKIDGSADHSVVREVETWFVNLIQDEDVLHDTKIDRHTLATIVAETGARVTDPIDLFYKKSSKESQVLDIGVIRYPDIDNPYFKVYRIKLSAWSTCERTVFFQRDSNGITGEFSCHKYKPRASVIERISRHVIEKAVEEAEAFFT